MASRQETDAAVLAIKADLLQKIERGELAPGDRLPTEAALATSYGVARNTIRNALAILNRDGAIERHVGRGTFIAQGTKSPVDAANSQNFTLEELLEVRLLFEPAMISLISGRATDEQLAELDTKLETLQVATDWQSFKQAEYDLHFEIVRLTQNRFLELIFELIINGRRAVAWQSPRPGISFELIKQASVSENALVVEAIKARNWEKSADLIKHHLMRIYVSISA